MVTEKDPPTTEPLRILTDHVYAEPLKDAVKIPHVMTCIHTAANDKTPPPLQGMDAYVGAIFKKAWVTGRDPVPLRAIFITGAGTDRIDFSAVPTACSVCTVHGHEYAAAEHCFMTMTALNRELFALDAALREGHWGIAGPYRRELRGRTLLIIGMGHIGRELARWGQFIGMRVIAITRSPSADRQRQLGLDALGGSDDLHDYLTEADFVVIAVPQTEQTIGMIGEQELRRCGHRRLVSISQRLQRAMFAVKLSFSRTGQRGDDPAQFRLVRCYDELSLAGHCGKPAPIGRRRATGERHWAADFRMNDV